jgi:hypothetical protein
MSTIDTSIRRPYFRKQEYPRVVDTGFNELTKTVSDTQVEDLINEYRKIANSLPPEIHGDIARNSGAALGIDVDEENFDEINRLNDLLDQLESEEFQEQTIGLREHPHFRNGTFIKGFKVKRPSGTIVSEDDLKLEKDHTFYFMQKGHKREIEKIKINNDEGVNGFFKFLYILRNKRRDWNDAVPFCRSEVLEKIPTAVDITYSTFGKETILTDINDLPPGYIDFSNKSAVFEKYRRNRPENTTVAEYYSLIDQANVNAINSADKPEIKESISRITNPPLL